MQTLKIYLPLIVLISIILGVSILLQFLIQGNRDRMSRMHIMMGVWFIAFGLLKLPDLKGFQESFSMYDLIAKSVPGRGMVYPFVEIILGIRYLAQPMGMSGVFLYIFTLIITGLGIGSIALKLINNERIQCACMGTLFSFPLSTVSLYENLLMFIMAARMLIDMNGMEMIMMNM